MAILHVRLALAVIIVTIVIVAEVVESAVQKNLNPWLNKPNLQPFNDVKPLPKKEPDVNGMPAVMVCVGSIDRVKKP